ncbi:MAG: hypothetical protein RI897_804 [Verrucomicrobiota bacterium]
MDIGAPVVRDGGAGGVLDHDCSLRAGLLGLGQSGHGAALDVFGVVMVLFGVAGLLAFEVYRILFDVGLEDIVGAHTEDLGQADEEVEEVDDFDPGVLFIELLVFGPPFPGDAIGEFGHFLGHGAAVIEDPFRFFFVRHAIGDDADAFVEGFLHTEEFAELVGFVHGGRRFLA